jgi:hypothetical protein
VSSVVPSQTGWLVHAQAIKPYSTPTQITINYLSGPVELKPLAHKKIEVIQNLARKFKEDHHNFAGIEIQAKLS